jgi:hypothetical protein
VHKRIGFLSERDALTKKKLVKLYLAGEDPYEKSLMRGTLEDRVLSLSHKGNWPSENIYKSGAFSAHYMYQS